MRVTNTSNGRRRRRRSIWWRMGVAISPGSGHEREKFEHEDCTGGAKSCAGNHDIRVLWEPEPSGMEWGVNAENTTTHLLSSGLSE